MGRFERTRDGSVEILKSQPSDKAQPRTPKSITRGGENPTTRATTVPAKAD